MRIITGKYKGRRFDVPRSFKARPTTDFAKENLFNVLNGYMDFDEGPTALDLFAGTGSISVEMLSRGCSRVVSVERDAQHYAFIAQCMDKLGDKAAMPVRADVFAYLQRCRQTFDLVFADPPYALENIDEIPDLVLARGILAPDGIFVLEHGRANDFSAHPNLFDHRHYGSVNFSFFRP
ncbi:MAG: 16S rRNA (guanine(966)-N(2))-methyltransferase RsmD [Bacteroidaceae bacterium]|nr:16S rRNA (guanine(966)-N(2))-methyltransferase RsmD [Bacteroidaceae bacterium]